MKSYKTFRKIRHSFRVMLPVRRSRLKSWIKRTRHNSTRIRGKLRKFITKGSVQVGFLLMVLISIVFTVNRLEKKDNPSEEVVDIIGESVGYEIDLHSDWLVEEDSDGSQRNIVKLDGDRGYNVAKTFLSDKSFDIKGWCRSKLTSIESDLTFSEVYSEIDNGTHLIHRCFVSEDLKYYVLIMDFNLQSVLIVEINTREAAVTEENIDTIINSVNTY